MTTKRKPVRNKPVFPVYVDEDAHRLAGELAKRENRTTGGQASVAIREQAERHGLIKSSKKPAGSS